jgi:hypothetical protein
VAVLFYASTGARCSILVIVTMALPPPSVDREHVRRVFELAVERLRESSRAGDFALFEAYDLDDLASGSYREVTARPDSDDGTASTRLGAIRRQFRLIVLEVLRESAASDDEFRAEARKLLGIEV